MGKMKNNFKKLFQPNDFSGLSVFGRGERFDWEILLAFFLLVIILAVSFSVYVFLGVRAGDIFKDDYKVPTHNETINRDMLDKVIKNFDVRAENLKNLQTQRPVFIDPSL
jgi:hypothetical protein